MQKGFVNVPLMVFITMLVLVAAVFYMVGRGSVEHTNLSTLPQPSATVSSTINDTLKVSPSPKSNWLNARIDKFDEHWPTYTINYPESWTLKEAPDSSAGKEYHLVKGGNKIDIYQGVIGTDHACLYDEGNPAQLYTNKKEIQQKGEVWRRSQLKDMSNGPDSYIICGNKVNGRFVSFTEVGSIHITTPGSDSAVLMEVDEILAKISY